MCIYTYIHALHAYSVNIKNELNDIECIVIILTAKSCWQQHVAWLPYLSSSVSAKRKLKGLSKSLSFVASPASSHGKPRMVV